MADEELREIIGALTQMVYDVTFENQALRELLAEKGLISPGDVIERAMRIRDLTRNEANQAVQAAQIEAVLQKRREQ